MQLAFSFVPSFPCVTIAQAKRDPSITITPAMFSLFDFGEDDEATEQMDATSCDTPASKRSAA